MTPWDTSPLDTGHDPWVDSTSDTSGPPCDPPCVGSGWTSCDGACVDVLSDMRNCGACGIECSSTRADGCTGGVCTCRGYTQCGATQSCCPDTGCRTLSTDPSNCGECGNVCPSGNTCVEGECLCGGVACDPGMGCCSGSCRDLRSGEARCEPVSGTFTCNFQCLIPEADASTDAGAGG